MPLREMTNIIQHATQNTTNQDRKHPRILDEKWMKSIHTPRPPKGGTFSGAPPRNKKETPERGGALRREGARGWWSCSSCSACAILLLLLCQRKQSKQAILTAMGRRASSTATSCSTSTTSTTVKDAKQHLHARPPLKAFKLWCLRKCSRSSAAASPPPCHG
jgi:hypothetical protein